MTLLVRRGQFRRAVERIVAGAAGVEVGFQRHGGRPVQSGFVRLGKLALAAQQVALEVVVVAGDDAGLIEDLHHLAAQVVGLRVGLGFAIDGAPHPQLRPRAFAQEGIRGPPQRVVGGAEPVIAAVPGVERLAGHVVQHPALARLHAGLMDAVAEQVVVVAHDDAVLGVDDLALVAFDVEDDPRGMELLDRRSGGGRVAVLEPVVGDGEDGAPERIGMGDGGRCRVDGRLAGGGLFLRAERAVLAAGRAKSASSRHPAAGGRTRPRPGRSWDRPPTPCR